MGHRLTAQPNEKRRRTQSSVAPRGRDGVGRPLLAARTPAPRVGCWALMADDQSRLFAVRFDIDSYRCLVEGVPNLIRVAAELDCAFTFFATMGRAISRRHVVGRGRRNDLAPVGAK